MDKREFTIFTDLYIKLQEQCKHVAKILSEYDSDFSKSRFNTWLLNYDRYAENKFTCYTEVSIYATGCYINSKSLYFPVDLLYATDNQIHLYARDKYRTNLSHNSR